MKNDSSNGPVDVSSIITQVSRDKTPQTGFDNKRSAVQSVRYTGAAKPPPQPKRSLFSKILCCGARDETIPQDRKDPSTPEIVRKNRIDTHNSPNSNFGRYAQHHSPSSKKADLGPLSIQNQGKKCLALDLDETLVHSSFQPVDNASFTIDVVIEGNVHNVFVMKRPGVDDFLTRMAKHYEIIIYTASLSKYADPLLDILDPKQTICKRLFRENCVFHDGHYVKDLSLLGRDLTQTIIVDNSPMSYMFHPDNAIDCSSFFDDPQDVELWQIADFLEGINNVEDVRTHCRHWRAWCYEHPSSVPTEQ